MRWLLAAGLLGLLLGACAPQPETELALRYCYRTLAEVDCHAQVLPGEEYRRVGFFDAALAR
ncbi:MAG: hypothetical protein V3T80_12145 [Kiloniellales bacterium]|jgi:hypothetical protein